MFGLQRNRARLCNETASEHSDTHSDVSARRVPARLHPRSSAGEMRSTVGSETASSAGLSFAGDATPANVFTKLPAPFVRRRAASAGGRANSGMWRRTLHTAGCSRGKWKPARPAAKKEADVSLCAVWPACTVSRFLET